MQHQQPHPPQHQQQPPPPPPPPQHQHPHPGSHPDYNSMYNSNHYSQGYHPGPYNSDYDQGSYNGQYYQQPYGGSPPYQSPQQMQGYQTHYHHGAPSRGGMYAPRGGYSRGGGLGNRGRLSRKRKPFVGGSLESQREWESQTACCFFLQGQCRFGERCRFVHDSRANLKCQFGDKCQKGHNNRGTEGEGGAMEPTEEYPSNEAN